MTNNEPVREQAQAWERAYTRIKQMILTLEMKPGESVSEPGLAALIGISRTPIREAMRRLEQEGLIITQNRRKRVYILRIAEINEIFDLKKAIEGMVARHAAERRDEETTREFAQVMDQMKSFSKRGFSDLTRDHALIREWLKLDRHFHEMLYRMAENRRAEQVVQTLNDQWHRLELGLLAMEGRIEQNIREHLEMGSSILAGQAERAASQMVEHLGSLHKTIIDIMNIFHFPV